MKDKAPDVITLNANGGFGKLAQTGVFYDFSDEPVLQTINPAVQEILAQLGNKEGEVNGLGYVNNANGVIYNQDIFEEQGLEVPETWDEFIAVCDALRGCRHHAVLRHPRRLVDRAAVVQRAGRVSGAGRLLGRDARGGRERRPGLARCRSRRTSPRRWTSSTSCSRTCRTGYRGKTYDDGNAAFANGEVAMLLQGIWAINPVKQVNPDIKAAIFPYPAATIPTTGCSSPAWTSS